MEPQRKSVPPSASEVVFLSLGSLALRTEGQTPWGEFPALVAAGDDVVGTTYHWTGAGSWKAMLDGQGGGSDVAPLVGQGDGSGGNAEQGRV